MIKLIINFLVKIRFFVKKTKQIFDDSNIKILRSLSIEIRGKIKGF